MTVCRAGCAHLAERQDCRLRRRVEDAFLKLSEASSVAGQHGDMIDPTQ